jgi:hypothetical protein
MINTVKSQLGFIHDYSKEFGGEKRLYKYYNVIIDNEKMVSLSIKWDYVRPDIYMIDTCLQDNQGHYIFIDCKSRKDCHKWIKENWERLTK